MRPPFVSSLVCCVIVAVGLPMTAAAQSFERIYPDHDVHDYLALVHWNGDTLYAAGNNSGFLRSVDAGLTWTPVFSTHTGYDFIRIGANSTGIFLLPAPWSSTETQFSDTSSTFILRYNPWTNDTTRIIVPCPVFDNSNNKTLRCDISITPDGIHVIESVKPDSTDPASPKPSLTHLFCRNGETVWSYTILPSTIFFTQPSIYFNDHSNGFLISPFGSKGLIYSTTDNGNTWLKVNGVNPSNKGVFAATCKATAQWLDDSTFGMATNNWSIAITTDMGGTWIEKPVPSPHISSFAFLTDGTGIVSGANLDVCRTTDFGNSWAIIHQVSGSASVLEMQTLLLDHSTSISAGYAGIMLRTTDAGTSWDMPLTSAISYSPIHFESDKDGLAQGGTVLIDLPKEYCRTSDGGATWNGAFSRIETSYAQIVPVDETQIWAIDYFTSSPDTLILLSSDGGANWIGACLSATLGHVRIAQRQVNSMVLCGKDSVMLFCDRGILRTTNRGATWEIKPQILSFFADSLDMVNFQVEIYCQDSRFQWFVTGNKILRSSDFGATWVSKYSIPVPQRLTGPILTGRAVDGMSVSACVEKTNGRMTFLLTTDAGDNWEEYENDTFRFSTSIFTSQQLFANGTGYVRGTRSLRYQNANIVYKTEDFWRTARPIFETHFSYGASNYSMYFRNADSGWIKSYYELYRTTNGGIDWVRTVPVVPRDVRLESVHPNPASANVGAIIGYTVTGDRPVSIQLDIFDCLGRRVCEQHATTAPPGRHEFRWDARNASPGVYIVRLASGGSVEAGKVIVR